MEERWTIDELIDVAAAALETTDYAGPASERIREKPDKRTTRYYTTLGLLDRPLEFRGRTAYYGRRHVLQLAAIKQLQAKGMTLVQIQQSLAGADDRRLENWAGVPEDFWVKHQPGVQAPPNPDALLAGEATRAPESPASVAVTMRATPVQRATFWRGPPTIVSAAPADPAPEHMPPPELHAVAALNLAPGVTLLLEHADSEQLDSQVFAELAPAIGFLVAELRRLKLIP